MIQCRYRVDGKGVRMDNKDKNKLNDLLNEALKDKDPGEIEYALKRLIEKDGKPGRKNKYYTHVQPHLKKIEQLHGKGMTKSAIADELKIDRSTLFDYINEHKELADAFDDARKQQLDLVEGALFQACIKEEREVEKVRVLANGSIVRYKEREIKDPDVQAIKFYLPNRDPERWANKSNIEISGIDDFFEEDDK